MIKSLLYVVEVFYFKQKSAHLINKFFLKQLLHSNIQEINVLNSLLENIWFKEVKITAVADFSHPMQDEYSGFPLSELGQHKPRSY